MTNEKAIATIGNGALALAPKSLDEVMKLSDFLAKSQIIPSGLRGKSADVAVILMTGLELDIGPMQALQNIVVVNGKPTAEAQLMIAMILGRCPEAKIEYDLKPGVAKVKMTRGDNSFASTWDVARASKMGLLEKDNYKKQLDTMLKWRAVSEAARTLFPDIVKGIYIRDEAEDIAQPDAATDKAARLTALAAKPATVEVLPPETKPEPAQPAPTHAKTNEEEIVIEESEQTSVVGDYAIKSAGPLRDKPLKSISAHELKAYADLVRLKHQKLNKALSGTHLEDLTRIDQWLDETTQATSAAEPAQQGEFGAFEGNPHTLK